MVILLFGVLIALAGITAYAFTHPVRFIVSFVQGVLTVAGIAMVLFMVMMGWQLGAAWMAIFGIVTVLILFGANRMSILKSRLAAPAGMR